MSERRLYDNTGRLTKAGSRQHQMVSDHVRIEYQRLRRAGYPAVEVKYLFSRAIEAIWLYEGLERGWK